MGFLLGTPGPDTFFGTPEPDEIFSFAGDDVLFGGGGDDRLDGGTGMAVAVHRRATGTYARAISQARSAASET